MNSFSYKKLSKLIIYTTLITLSTLFFWLNWLSPFTLIIINGHSMEPTYKNGSWHIANKFNRRLEKGDVIIFKIKNETYIKRIVAMPGDEIPVCYGIDDGKIYANLATLDYVKLNLDYEWITIPLDYIWVEGDAVKNNMSLGSGNIGLVSTSDIIGVMNATNPPEEFWYPEVVNQKTKSTPGGLHHKT